MTDWKQSWERAMDSIHALEKRIAQLEDAAGKAPVAEFTVSYDEGIEGYQASADAGGVSLFAYSAADGEWKTADDAIRALSALDGLRVSFIQ